MGDYTLLYILFAPFVGAITLIFVSNRQAMLVRGIARDQPLSPCSPPSTFLRLRSRDGGIPIRQQIRMVSPVGHLAPPRGGWDRDPAGAGIEHLVVCRNFRLWHIKDRTKEFYIWLLILAAATIGVFMSLDLFFLFFFYEMSVIPMYLLLGMWGSHTKKYNEMTDPEGIKQRDSVGFILNFESNSKEYAA
jgi:NADH:ubiquinone oxidoreductase subunit 4 (chain M)